MDLDIQQMANDRKKEVGKRIKEEREKRKWTQANLGELVADLSGISNADGRTKSQGNISDWERGTRLPSLADLMCLSKLFNCDLGYLLCDYDFKTYGENEMAALLGLPPEIVNILKTWATWGMQEYLDALTALILDVHYKLTHHRAVLDLINFFFSYRRDCPSQQLWRNGRISDADTDGTIDIHALRLSDSTIESAVLVEIQEALRALKHSDCIKWGGGNDG